MARSDPQVNLRMPAELKDSLDAAAAKNKRSLTAEVVARLQASFQPTPSWSKTFPYAAASASGDETYREAAAQVFELRFQREQLADRIRDLQGQLVGLDTQAVSLQRELLTVQAEIEAADAQKAGKTVAALLKHRQQLSNLLRQRDAQAKAVKVALEGARSQLKQLEAN